MGRLYWCWSHPEPSTRACGRSISRPCSKKGSTTPPFAFNAHRDQGADVNSREVADELDRSPERGLVILKPAVTYVRAGSCLPHCPNSMGAPMGQETRESGFERVEDRGAISPELPASHTNPGTAGNIGEPPNWSFNPKVAGSSPARPITQSAVHAETASLCGTLVPEMSFMRGACRPRCRPRD